VTCALLDGCAGNLGAKEDMCHANCAGDPIGAPQIRPETKVPVEVWRTRFNRQGNVGEPEWPPAAMLEEVE